MDRAFCDPGSMVSDNRTIRFPFACNGELVVREDSEEGILYDMCFRFTVVLEKSENGWKVVHIHQSVADPNQMSDEFSLIIWWKKLIHRLFII